MKYMLDTNICIYLIKKKPKKVFENLKKHKSSDICISSITLSELLYGAEKSQYVSRNKLAIFTLLSNIQVMSFDENAAFSYGEIRASLERSGNVIGGMDMLIAGHAKSLGLILVSNNVKEFKRVDGLKLENWA